MKNATQRANWLINAALPLAFFGSGFLNMIAYVLGLHTFDTLRTIFTVGILGAAALLCFSQVVLLYLRTPVLRRTIQATSMILVLFGLIYLWALLIQAKKTMILKEALVQGCYLVFSWSAIILIVAEKRLRPFLRSCRIYALILSPIVLYYCVRFYLPGADYYTNNLGVLGYMPLAYTLLTAGVFLLLEVLLYDRETGKAAPFFRWNLGMYVLFSAAIALSGTKGTVLCLVFGSAVLVLYLILNKKSATPPPRLCIFPFSACLALFLFAFVVFPNSEVDNRLADFLNELTSSDPPAITEEDTQKAFEAMESLQPESSAPAAAEDIVNAVTGQAAKEQLESGTISQEEYEALKSFSKTVNNTAMGGRMYLWQSAIKEIKSAPIIGQGPFFFQCKYGTYPHNFFFELATDFGLILTFAVFLLGLYVFIRLICLSLRFPAYMAFTLYVLTFLPQRMVSGSIYGQEVFFQYGFCILLVFKGKIPSLKEVFESL